MTPDFLDLLRALLATGTRLERAEGDVAFQAFDGQIHGTRREREGVVIAIQLRVAFQYQGLTGTDHALTLRGNAAWKLDGNCSASQPDRCLDAHALVFGVGRETGELNGIEAFGSDVAKRRELERAMLTAVDQGIIGRLATESGASCE